MSQFSVVVCGGGVAGMEAVLRLRRLTGFGYGAGESALCHAQLCLMQA